MVWPPAWWTICKGFSDNSTVFYMVVVVGPYRAAVFYRKLTVLVQVSEEWDGDVAFILNGLSRISCY